MQNEQPSLARALFEEITQAADPAGQIRAWVGSAPPTFETEYLDFKCEPVEDADLKRTWSRTVAGFANTEGGVVVWGIDARKDKANHIDAGVLKSGRWWFVAVVVVVVVALGATVFQLAASGRDSIERRARLLRPGMTRAEMVETMGCEPLNSTFKSTPLGLRMDAGTMLIWVGGGGRYFIWTMLDPWGKLIADPIIEDKNPPALRRALDCVKAHIGW
jgi:hypothetical protein